jgi:uracil phosphoribosyltransferase
MLKLIDHPLIKHKLAFIRRKETTTKDFREYVNEIAGLMAYEITRDLPVREIVIDTPLSSCKACELSKEIILVPVLRAGLGMVDGIASLITTAKVGHIGLFRDHETLEPNEYYAKFPSDLSEAIVMVLDPMLATGGSASAAITAIKNRGAKTIRLVCIVGAPEGVERVEKEHPDVDIYLAALDSHLNDRGYIVPGLGDAGDRLFGTL